MKMRMLRELIRFAAGIPASCAALVDRAADAFARLEYRCLMR
ncbi:MAG TPA: hypothetical protein VKR55_16560 [Bradyrhizobium sp.]|nr:hypothetical protein [Bradyrhizobium sp.]HLZ03747.1 hypothetical protein [Bradyrhizobium sp.]